MFPKKTKIIVCDDSKLSRRVITNTLIEEGYTAIQQAEDAMKVIDYFQRKEERYDLLLLDFNMPGMNGVELIQNIRASKNYRSLRVIMISAESEKSVILSALKSGVNDFLLKPITKEDLLKKMESVWNKTPMDLQSDIIDRSMGT